MLVVVFAVGLVAFLVAGVQLWFGRWNGNWLSATLIAIPTTIFFCFLRLITLNAMKNLSPTLKLVIGSIAKFFVYVFLIASFQAYQKPTNFTGLTTEKRNECIELALIVTIFGLVYDFIAAQIKQRKEKRKEMQ